MSEEFDVRDLMLEAEAEVQAIVREVLRDLMKPQLMAQIRATWLHAPDEVKEQFKRERPSEYAELMEDLKLRR